MKKLLALLMALLLPLCACAETYGFSISVETDETAFVQLFKEAILSDPTVDPAYAETYAMMMQKVLDGLSASISVQDDAASMELYLDGGRLFDLTAYEVEQSVYLTSSMLQGYALVDNATEPAGEDESLINELNQTDWASVCSSMQTGLENWLSAIEPTVTIGAFEGDAFQGGTKCTTWMLSDMDVAALANEVLTQEVRNVLTTMLTAMSLDAEKALEEFDALNDRVADEDRYFYVLRVVQDDFDSLVGMSVTILDEHVQVATASFGTSDTGIRLVVGLGFNAQNYWWEFTADKQQQENAIRLNGVSREWVADKQDVFSYVSAAYAPVSECSWACEANRIGSKYAWNASVTSGDETVVSAKGTMNTETLTFTNETFLGDAADAPLSVKVSMSPANEIQPLDQSLKSCSMSDPSDAELFDELTQHFTASLLARLMKLLPMDLLLKLNDMSIQ